MERPEGTAIGRLQLYTYARRGAARQPSARGRQGRLSAFSSHLSLVLYWTVDYALTREPIPMITAPARVSSSAAMRACASEFFLACNPLCLSCAPRNPLPPATGLRAIMLQPLYQQGKTKGRGKKGREGKEQKGKEEAMVPAVLNLYVG